ncbi:hypothetical protein EC991_004566 [Linnemannia zychae]|nr:hypothetical protein EC991_004566 [Linnemannia zychae]
MDLSIQIACAKDFTRSPSVFSPKVTRAGRHAGVTEVYALGCPSKEIRHLGRWIMIKMKSYYLPIVPITSIEDKGHGDAQSANALVPNNLRRGSEQKRDHGDAHGDLMTAHQDMGINTTSAALKGQKTITEYSSLNGDEDQD